MKRLLYRAALILCFVTPVALIALQARQERIERQYRTTSANIHCGGWILTKNRLVLKGAPILRSVKLPPGSTSHTW
ncbi:hypothetical protein [Armatimonas sp.]|uniref:hypothetical protein n=1 Tax=Armatimonas sp. TaxID=1872638 RepID=UPI00286A284E|nr:hypothetical protein [Armatimonas sp.]